MISSEQMCTRCVMDSSVPDIRFDSEGVCNYCKLHDAMDRDFPYDEKGKNILTDTVRIIKKRGRNCRYDCIVGVSGGTDSTYLLHWAKTNGLRVLAVNFDNGWHSEIAVSNIKKVLAALDVDLITYVVDYDEMNDILLSYMKAGLPWIDIASDIGIATTLYSTATNENVKYILVGNHFRTEGKQPTEWTYSDGRQLKYVHKKFGTKKLRTFHNQTVLTLLGYEWLRGIKMIKPLYYMDYHKKDAMPILEEAYEWKYYGGHHHESIFTRFAISYWQYRKFNIDKRRVTLSAQVRSGEITRDEALELLKRPHYDPGKMYEDKDYVIKKLGITQEEFRRIWEAPNKSFHDYPSYYPLMARFKGLTRFIFTRILGFKPMMSYELEK